MSKYSAVSAYIATSPAFSEYCLPIGRQTVEHKFSRNARSRTSQNMEETIKTLQSKDIKIIHGQLIIENEAAWVYFADPDFNILEFIQRF